MLNRVDVCRVRHQRSSDAQVRHGRERPRRKRQLLPIAVRRRRRQQHGPAEHHLQRGGAKRVVAELVPLRVRRADRPANTRHLHRDHAEHERAAARRRRWSSPARPGRRCRRSRGRGQTARACENRSPSGSSRSTSADQNGIVAITTAVNPLATYCCGLDDEAVADHVHQEAEQQERSPHRRPRQAARRSRASAPTSARRPPSIEAQPAATPEPFPAPR